MLLGHENVSNALSIGLVAFVLGSSGGVWADTVAQSTVAQNAGAQESGTRDADVRIAWNEQVALDGRGVMLRAAAFDEVASELVIGVLSFAATASVDRALLDQTVAPSLLRVDRQGELISTVPLAGRLEGASIQALDVRLDRHIVLAVALADGRPAVAVTEPEGNLVSLWTWPSTVEPLAAQKILAQTDGTILVAGVDGADGVVRRIDATGKIVLERRIGDQSLARNIDVTPGPRGGFVVTVSTGDYENPAYAIGPGRVVVVIFDRQGRALAEQAIDGRHGRVARTVDGYGLLIDRGQQAPQDWWLVRYDNAFQEQARLRLHQSETGLGNLSIVPWVRGGFLALGASSGASPGASTGELWGAALDRDGREIGTLAWTADEPVRGGFFHMVEAGTAVFALSQTSRRGADRLQTVIQVVKVDPHHAGRGAIQ